MGLPGVLDRSGDNSLQLNHRGWEQISDTQYTPSNRLQINTNNRTKIPNNAGSVINSQLPDGVISFWDSANNKLAPDRVGDFYLGRLTFNATPNKNNSSALIELDIGGTQGVIYSTTENFVRGAGNPQQIVVSLPIYTLGTFVQNGGEFYFTGSERFFLDTISIVIFRAFRGKDPVA